MEDIQSIDKLFEQEILSDMEEDVMYLFTEGSTIDQLADLPIDDEDLDSLIDEESNIEEYEGDDY